ncbi:uncharacterized protein LOC143913044 [Arctopsyche grandis]|uniref:uncharacterized protein LOC143913044 n=1 Tax=Arctopsyche grandis TaxID=121162 RepID=UPI00406D9B0E
MSQNRELEEWQRANIVLLNSQGMSELKIAQKMNCSRGAVQSTLKRFRETGSNTSKPRSGRKRATSVQEDCNSSNLVRLSLKNPKMTSSEPAAELAGVDTPKISARTVRRGLNEGGLKGCKARKNPGCLRPIRRKDCYGPKNINS